MRKLIAMALCLLMASPTAAPAAGAELPADYYDVMSGIGLSTPATLSVTRPAGSTAATTAAGYYLTGTSDPGQPLTMNGRLIETRGAKGSFGVYVSLAYGANECTFAQGGLSRTVMITRNETGAYATTTTLASLFPASDTVVRSGEAIKITCVAPAGAEVWATVGGRSVQLRQNVAAAVAGVPANFSGEITAGSVSGMVNAGRVSYTLSFNGRQTAHSSAGAVYVAAQNHPVVVQVVDTSASLFRGESTGSGFVTVLDFGAVDRVEEVGGSMYRLAMGGWVSKSAVQLRPDMTAVGNQISEVSFSRTGRDEVYALRGTSFPGYTVSETDDSFAIRFAATWGLSSLPAADSALFSSAEASYGDDGFTTLTFTKKAPLWGFMVEYENGGVTRLTFRAKPVLAGGSAPLSGVTVCIDAGHGGADPGALGIPYTSGPTEADINLAHALALRNKLRLLGATVVMVRTTDENSTMNSRVRLAMQNRADFYISLHSNAVAGNGAGKGGTEVYYFRSGAESFADTVSARLSAATGRLNRGGKFSNYRVTLGGYAPGVLVEMGFVTDPVEYDRLIDAWSIYQSATAIAGSVTAALA